jgi:hypothetical protein
MRRNGRAAKPAGVEPAATRRFAARRNGLTAGYSFMARCDLRWRKAIAHSDLIRRKIFAQIIDCLSEIWIADRCEAGERPEMDSKNLSEIQNYPSTLSIILALGIVPWVGVGALFLFGEIFHRDSEYSGFLALQIYAMIVIFVGYPSIVFLVLPIYLLFRKNLLPNAQNYSAVGATFGSALWIGIYFNPKIIEHSRNVISGASILHDSAVIYHNTWPAITAVGAYLIVAGALSGLAFWIVLAISEGWPLLSNDKVPPSRTNERLDDEKKL